jgi:diaminohydroxyphosphoribosylaminopyrimidine deaminase/5-amino-6-(5-phosphoribosylamino)uracil reductase
MTSKDYLHRAFLLAQKANAYDIRPNPYVGAIIVSNEGEIVGEGYHQKAGQSHAEVLAIQDALSQKADLATCTLYVTLEPCSHFGKTPPCTQFIITHKIPKVVIGSMDPNPLVSGAEQLREHGVEIEFCILPEIVEWNQVFNINQIDRRPKFILKSAITLNGKIADQFGDSKWISNTMSRSHVHSHLRNKVDAILTTAKTVLKDNARFNIRQDGTADKELSVIVLDNALDLLKNENSSLALFYKRTHTKIYLVTSLAYDGALHPSIELIQIPSINGELDLVALSTILLQKNICEILLEAGATLNANMMHAKLVDELYFYVCPTLLLDNNAMSVFNSHETQSMSTINRLQLLETFCLQDDIVAKYKILY